MPGVNKKIRGAKIWILRFNFVRRQQIRPKRHCYPEDQSPNRDHKTLTGDTACNSKVGELQICQKHAKSQLFSPDEVQVSIILLRHIPKGKVETWVIALAIIGGILLLTLLTMALVKAGFFQRKKRDELLIKKRQVSHLNWFYLFSLFKFTFS
jgi:hypothetical protein